jgi:hypothetical protein
VRFEQNTWGSQIPALQDNASRLLSLANDIMSTRIEPYDTTDLLGVMIDVFTQKLIDHLKSICILVDAGQYQDATIISRSSYESMGILLWSAHGPANNPRDSRPLKWFAYEYIDRYRQMDRYRQLGMEPNSETEKAIRKGVQEFADLFLTEKAEKSIGRGEPPKKPLFRDRVKFGNIVTELKENGLIDPQVHQRYAMLSQWLHGTSQGMGLVFQYDGKRLSKENGICKSLGADAIIIGIHSLSNSVLLFNDHFNLDFQDKLRDSQGSFSKFLQNLKAKGLF